MIRVALAHPGRLLRGSLAFILREEPDLDVVAETESLDELAAVVLRHAPQVAVLDAGLVPADAVVDLAELPRRLPRCQVLVLAQRRRCRIFAGLLAKPPAGLGFLAKEGSPRRLITAVRVAATGERVLDPHLLASGLHDGGPLTPRETQVLSLAAEGVPVVEIASRLDLSTGTVRNHLSRIIGKLGARSRIEAARIAHDSGWI